LIRDKKKERQNRKEEKTRCCRVFHLISAHTSDKAEYENKMNVQGELLTPGMTYYYNTRHYTSIKYSAATWYTCCFDDDRKEMLHTRWIEFIFST
jgi:hypothetical protein